MPKRTMTEKDLWNTIAYLEDALVSTEMELEEAKKELLERDFQWHVSIRATDKADLYDLWDNNVQLLSRAPMAEIAHLLQHGGECPEGCKNCPR